MPKPNSSYACRRREYRKPPPGRKTEREIDLLEAERLRALEELMRPLMESAVTRDRSGRPALVASTSPELLEAYLARLRQK